MRSLHLFTSLILLSMNPTFGQDFGFEATGSNDQLNQKSRIRLVSGKSYDSPLANFYQAWWRAVMLWKNR